MNLLRGVYLTSVLSALLLTIFFLLAWNDIGVVPVISLDMSIQEAAKISSMRPRDFANELGISEPVSKRVPMIELGITAGQLEAAVHHISSRGVNKNAFIAYSLLAIACVIWLFGLSKGLYSGRWPHILALILAVVFGFILGKTPNPMQSVSQLFKLLTGNSYGGTTVILTFLFFALFSIFANKIICGWACPLGAVQELIYSLPLMKSLKRRSKLSFKVSNSIRIFIIAFMSFLLVTGLIIKRGRTLYHEVNLFNIFDLHLDGTVMITTAVAVFLASFIIYRPFCSFICPFGLISWFLEKISVLKVRVNRETCISCGKCEALCPTDAVHGYISGNKFPADCFDCGRCFGVCPVNAIGYGMTKKL